MNGAGSLKLDKVLFEAAAALDDLPLRDEFLATACAGDAARRARIQEWLDARSAADAFFHEATLVREQAGTEVAATLVANAEEHPTRSTDNLPGSRIGNYQIVDKIGEGAYGTVYVAEQSEPVRRRVALKILRLGLDTQKVIARFEMERQALALMDHPHIARVFDAGISDAGRPFFVMEWVQGVKITEHCDATRLGLRQRLELFIEVCDAIQHAHQKGVIHRDIKPSNILVSSQDGQDLPKVIDFGIARAIEGRLADDTGLTVHGQLVGTPAYMSPEQAEGGADPDTRGDVYSLGVLLCVILTGKTPVDGKRLADAGILEMLRILREEDAPLPSAILARMEAGERAAAAAARGCDASRLVAAVQGDLDGIVAKATEKDRRNRYDTVNGLALDIQRHLNDEPVSARPPGRIYLLRKLIRRNKVAFVASSAVVASLIGGVAVASWFYLREREAREIQTRLRGEADMARAGESRLLRQSRARESVSQAAILLAEGKITEADALLVETPPKTIEPSIESANVFRALGEWNAIRQRWKQSAECYLLYLRAARIDSTRKPPGEPLIALAIAPVLVKAERLTEYLTFREEILSRYGQNLEPVEASSLLKTCLLAPADADYFARLKPCEDVLMPFLTSQASHLSMNAYQCAFAALSLGMLDYRRGDFAGALEWSRRCLVYPNENQSREAAAHALAAIASQRLGQADAARGELEKSRRYFVAPFTQDVLYPRGQGQGFWLDWAIAEVLKKEAESLVK